MRSSEIEVRISCKILALTNQTTPCQTKQKNIIPNFIITKHKSQLFVYLHEFAIGKSIMMIKRTKRRKIL